MIDLYSHQLKAVESLHSGSILCGGVGTGKSITSLAYYFTKECGGYLNSAKPLKTPKDLYIITTARKRDSLEWEKECSGFCLSNKREISHSHVLVTIDSWNNIHKYTDVEKAFFIFDEQRVVGSGAWVKSFLKITKKNTWILLSATPGDTWMDYIPVFVANGYYKNKSAFLREHVVFSRYTKFPKVERYLNVTKLKRIKSKIVVLMEYEKNTEHHDIPILCGYDEKTFNYILKNRYNIYKNKPIENISELCYALRKVVNSDKSRLDRVIDILKIHPKVIIFYNFDYELDILRTITKKTGILTAEWNGKIHQPVPSGYSSWAYLVQYAAGAEGWNCIETDTVIFYSLNYSYRSTVQAAGRIDRLNTPYTDLYFYKLFSNSSIDRAISKALDNKEKFNENTFIF